MCCLLSLAGLVALVSHCGEVLCALLCAALHRCQQTSWVETTRHLYYMCIYKQQQVCQAKAFLCSTAGAGPGIRRGAGAFTTDPAGLLHSEKTLLPLESSALASGCSLPSDAELAAAGSCFPAVTQAAPCTAQLCQGSALGYH